MEIKSGKSASSPTTPSGAPSPPVANVETLVSADRYRSMIEIFPEAVFVNRGNRIALVNPAAIKLFRAAKAEDLLGKSPFELFHPECHALVKARIEHLLGGQRVALAEEKIVCLDGTVVDVEVTAAPYADGDVRAILVILRDITERRRIDEELRKAREELEARVHERTAALEQERVLLHALMDNLPHSIYFKDAQSRFLNINRALASYFKMADASEAIGKTDRDIFAEEHARQAFADEQEIIRSGEPVLDKEEKETWPDGRVTWALSTKMPLRDAEGRIIGTFGISRDITEKKQAAEALQAAKEAAETANRAKSAFLANMSHEIRTPLNAIIGMTELVLKSDLSIPQREFLTTVRDSGEALLSVLNDILDFSKIEAGRMGLEREVFDLRESLGDTMKSFALRAHRQGLELACFVHPEIPRLVVGDYNRLRQVVMNLVSNAIKFTDAGEVVLEVELEDHTEHDALFHFTVRDTGIGIPQEKQALIFEMFEQADNSMTRRHGGTGLGLAIVSRLVELMEGRIWVESEPNRGSRFHFTARLGLAKGDLTAAEIAEPIRLHDMPVLVVDDNATNRRILEEACRSWHMIPTTASSAAEAIRLLREAHRASDPFQMVLTDAHMPQVDGFTLSQWIKQDSHLGSTVVMMLTSGDHPEDMARCEQLGIDAYLLKPIKQSELLEAIEMALGGTHTTRVETTCPPQPRLGQLRVLLAEDSLVNQKLAVALMEGEGHRVDVVNNGREALAAVQNENYDLILMDVQMPEVDGLEATANIRANERLTDRHLPIIAMTAHALKGDRERCLAAGMDGYVAKPIRAQQLFETIESVIATIGAPLASHVSESEESCVNWSEALAAVQGNRGSLRLVVEASLEETPKLMARIRQSLEDRDATGLRHTAHTLKGSLRYFGLSPAYQEALALEELGRRGELDAALAAFQRLETQAARMMQEMHRHIDDEATERR